MTTIKIPTPLRAYTGELAEIPVQGATVGEALTDLLGKYPDLRTQLFDGERLRNFVNIFINDEDIRYRDGLNTDLTSGENLRIIPSIAGGNALSGDRLVDHSVIRVSQASLIAVLIVGFILNSWLLVALVSIALLIAAVQPSASPFRALYVRVLRPAALVRPDVRRDNPEPHRFSQGFGSAVTALATIALLLGASALGWVLVWLVVGLAALNLFAGICVGCLMYYQLSRRHIPGFTRLPFAS